MSPCVRKAWLVLGNQSIQLEDRAAGYLLSSLDLGYGSPRVVDNNRPDADGVDDRTQFQGGRVVSADLTALTDLGARVDEVALSFGPYMQASQRPVLHYVLDAGSNPERTLTLRPDGYAFKIEDTGERDIHLQWVAPDPIAYDPISKLATAWAGATVQHGRQYPLSFPRTYASGPGGVRVDAVFSVTGDYPAQPVIRIYGPITNPRVLFAPNGGGLGPQIPLKYQIGGGQHVTVDTKAHTVYLGEDSTASLLSAVDWVNLWWPVLTPQISPITMILQGTNTTGLSQAQATWTEGYL
jgi:hypothetical protein